VTLSVVLASSHSDERFAEAAGRLLPQCRRWDAELIASRPVQNDVGSHTRSIEGCRMISCRQGATLPEIRGAGLAAANTDWVLLTEDNCVAHPDWIARMSAGMRQDVDVIGGSVSNPRPARAIDAAACYAEYGSYGPLRSNGSPGRAPLIAAANAGYRRSVCRHVAAWAIDGDWEDTIHQRLAARGANFGVISDAVVEQNLQHQLGAFFRNRFRHGHSYALRRRARMNALKRLAMIGATPMLAPLLCWRSWRASGRETPGDFFRALPFTLLFFTGWALGEAWGYATASDAP
jgi:GT2 family glycosyltransferase